MTWLGDNANSATNELAWYPPPSVERKAPASHEKDAFGEPEMLALMAMRNPMLMAVVSQLQGTALAGAWNLRVAAAHALGKIAALSDEPFRFHCYTLLATLAGQNTDDTLGAVPRREHACGTHLLNARMLRAFRCCFSHGVTCSSCATASPCCRPAHERGGGGGDAGRDVRGPVCDEAAR